MKPGDRTTIPTVAEVVRDGAAICDPDGAEAAVTALFEAFEDDERPATAAEDLAGELLGTADAIDPEGDDPAVRMAAACAAWLATNPAQADAHDHVLREAARLVFNGEPPAPVAAWLEARGVEVG